MSAVDIDALACDLDDLLEARHNLSVGADRIRPHLLWLVAAIRHGDRPDVLDMIADQMQARANQLRAKTVRCCGRPLEPFGDNVAHCPRCGSIYEIHRPDSDTARRIARVIDGPLPRSRERTA